MKERIETHRSSHPELFLEKGVLKICCKCTGEHPCRSVISIKLLFNSCFKLRYSLKILHVLVSSYRSSRPEVFYKLGFLKSFVKFTRKHLCWNLFFNKVAGLKPEKKKQNPTKVFSCEFCKISKSIYFIEHLRWLLQINYNS